MLSSDSTKLHLMLINRDYDSTVTATVQGTHIYTAGEAWYRGHSDSLLHQQSLPSITGNQFTYSIPPMRACHLILWNPAGAATQPGPAASARPFALFPNPVRSLSQLRFSRPGHTRSIQSRGRK